MEKWEEWAQKMGPFRAFGELLRNYIASATKLLNNAGELAGGGQ
jgi:hypothetical protein